MALPAAAEARLFYQAAKQRMADAKFLLEGNRNTAAVYLAGYAVDHSGTLKRREAEVFLATVDAILKWADGRL